jgi:hypothetical protein
MCLPPHLRTETNPVSETLCFIVSRILDDGQSPKTQLFTTLRVVDLQNISLKLAEYLYLTDFICVSAVIHPITIHTTQYLNLE